MKPSDHNSPLLTSNSSLPVVLQLWTVLACLIPNVWLSFSDNLGFLGGLVNTVLPFGLYLLLMSVTQKVGKATLWMTILFVFAAFQSVLLYMYGRCPIAVDMFLNVATTNPGEVVELLGNLMVIMVFIFAVYLPPIIAAIIACRKHWRLPRPLLLRSRKAGYLFTAGGAVLLIISLFFGFNPLNELYPLNIAYNLEVAVHRTVRVSNYDKTSADFRFDATATRADSIAETYVVIVGETSRAENWQLLGYGRPTTPQLTDLQGLVAFPYAISQSNTTHKSVPMLLSHLDATTFGDEIYSTKSLITAFREAGYRTWFVSNQNRNHSFIDFFGEEADTCLFLKDNVRIGNPSYDTDLLEHLDRALSSPEKKKLIVLHAYGSHFNYVDRYPKEMAVFTPDTPAEATKSGRPRLINAYDNTIHFTAEFVRGAIDRLSADSTAVAGLIYTSDHGEDIFDDSRGLFLHASPIPSYWQIHVPLLVWLNPGSVALQPDSFKNLNANRGKFVASSKSFFHTILDMAGISTRYLQPDASLLSPSYTPSTAVYLNDHNDAVLLRDCGILPQDIQKLQHLNVPLQP